MKRDTSLSTELVGEIYRRVGDYRALPDLLGLVAQSTSADAVRLGLDLGYGYRHDCFVGAAGDPETRGVGGATPDATPARRSADAQASDLPSGWVDQRALPVGEAGRRGAPRSGIALLRHRGSPAFDPAEREYVSLLMPHLNRAITLAHELERSRQREACAFAALDHADQGILLVDPQGAVLHGNARARELLERARLRVDQKLVFADRLQQSFYDNALVQAARPERRDPIDLLLDGHPPILLRIHPAPRSGNLPTPLTLTLRSQTLGVVQLSDTLRRHFDLTPGEFKLCGALAAGHTLKHCAQNWDRSYDTLRSQLKNLLAKTGTHRQAELVALLAAFRET